jgi:hypothetical protein
MREEEKKRIREDDNKIRREEDKKRRREEEKNIIREEEKKKRRNEERKRGREEKKKRRREEEKKRRREEEKKCFSLVLSLRQRARRSPTRRLSRRIPVVIVFVVEGAFCVEAKPARGADEALTRDRQDTHLRLLTSSPWAVGGRGHRAVLGTSDRVSLSPLPPEAAR